MNRKIRPTRPTQQIKEEQINFLLKDIEKNVEEYKETIELKDKQLSDIKKVFQGIKKSYRSATVASVVLENKQLKEYLANIKKDTRNISIVNNRNNIQQQRKF